MKRSYILFVLIIFLFGVNSMDAQVRKGGKRHTQKRSYHTQRNNTRKAGNITPVITDITSSKATESSAQATISEQKKYKSFSNPLVLRYLKGGYVSGNKLTLMAKDKYDNLDFGEKKSLIKLFETDFPDCEIMVHIGESGRELWIRPYETIIEKWTIGDMGLQPYRPLEVQSGSGKQLFYNVGGSMGGTGDVFSGNLYLRAGTFLFKHILDASISCSVGFVNSGNDKTDFTGDISADSRTYIRIRKFNISPYIGVGASWVYAPSNYIEPRLLSGVCLFVGPGNLDIGYHYGTKSKGAFTLGYTFSPQIRTKLPSLKKAKKSLAK